MAPADKMKAENKKDSSNPKAILERFQDLGLHQEALQFLATEVPSQLRMYHYYDLIKLPHYQKIKELPKNQQKALLQNLIENRKTLAVNNERTLAQLILPIEPNQEWAILLFEELRAKLAELNELYEVLDHAIPWLAQAHKVTLATELKKESTKNLSCVIKLRSSVIHEKSTHLLKEKSDP